MLFREKVLVALMAVTMCIGLLHSSCEKDVFEYYEDEPLTEEVNIDSVLRAGFLETHLDSLSLYQTSQWVAYEYFMEIYNPDKIYYQILPSKDILEGTKIKVLGENDYEVTSRFYIRDMEAVSKYYLLDYRVNMFIYSDDNNVDMDPFWKYSKCSLTKVESFEIIKDGYKYDEGSYYDRPHISVPYEKIEMSKKQ